MTKTAYIAGKVTGLPIEEVKAKFAAKETELIEKGYRVFNPCDAIARVTHQLKQEPSYNHIMGYCLKEMSMCDEVHLLPCWKESKGARLEQYVATTLKMKIVYP